MIMTMIYGYLVYLDLQANHEHTRSIVLLIIGSVFGRLAIVNIFQVGYINIITPEAIGSTFITVLMCWLNLWEIMPATIGLKLVTLVNYNFLAVTCLALQAGCIFGYRSFVDKLDTLDKNE